MRLCLIGNSHLLALQAAQAADPGRWPGLSLRLHGFRGDTLGDTALRDGRLLPLTAAAAAQMQRLGGSTAIDLRDCDAIVIVGFGHKLVHLMRLWKAARWPGLPSLDAAGDLALMGERLVSAPAALAAATAQLADQPCWRFAAQLRGIGRPIALIGHPNLHQRARFLPRGQFYALPRAIATGDGPALLALHRRAGAGVAAATGVTLIDQPDATLQDDLLTGAAFMAGTVPTPRGPQPDITHPNARYGALMLDLLQERLAA